MVWGECMKIIVISDSHGGGIYIKKVLDDHRDADAVFFLGDGISDLFSLREKYPKLAFIGVRGNCDIGYLGDMYSVGVCEQITLEGKRIFACHGHTYSVKGGVGTLVSAARAREADIVLFGHTHKRMDRYIPEDGEGRALYLINPGSIGGRGGEGHSFCILDIRDGGVLASFGEV